MKLLRDVVDWVRSGVGATWRAVAPHAGPGVAGGVAAQIIRTRRELVLENAMLRHQVVILRRKSPRPRLTAFDRLRLPVAAAVLRTWRRTLDIVQPETVLRWHREGFCMFWRRRSRSKSVEHRVAAGTIALIREMATKNRLRGADRQRAQAQVGRELGQQLVDQPPYVARGHLQPRLLPRSPERRRKGGSRSRRRPPHLT